MSGDNQQKAVIAREIDLKRRLSRQSDPICDTARLTLTNRNSPCSVDLIDAKSLEKSSASILIIAYLPWIVNDLEHKIYA